MLTQPTVDKLQALKPHGKLRQPVTPDTTSSYFEGRGPEGLAAYGYSRDQPQVLIGVLMTEEGYPVAHEVFPGNMADGATVATPSRPCGGAFSWDGSSSWPTGAW